MDDHSKRGEPAMTNSVVGMVTCSSRAEARQNRQGGARKKLAACVNILDGVESHYWWQGKLENARECLLLIKTTQSKDGRRDEHDQSGAQLRGAGNHLPADRARRAEVFEVDSKIGGRQMIDRQFVESSIGSRRWDDKSRACAWMFVLLCVRVHRHWPARIRSTIWSSNSAARTTRSARRRRTRWRTLAGRASRNNSARCWRRRIPSSGKWRWSACCK